MTPDRLAEIRDHVEAHGTLPDGFDAGELRELLADNTKWRRRALAVSQSLLRKERLVCSGVDRDEGPCVLRVNHLGFCKNREGK